METDGVAMAAVRRHGGRLAAAVYGFPDAPQPWIDLSTGINPWPWPMPAIPGKMWERLPDPAALRELEQAAAEYFGVDRAEALVAVPGSEIGLRQIARSEEHTSALQSLMRISYAVFCLKKNNNTE